MRWLAGQEVTFNMVTVGLGGKGSKLIWIPFRISKFSFQEWALVTRR